MKAFTFFWVNPLTVSGNVFCENLCFVSAALADFLEICHFSKIKVNNRAFHSIPLHLGSLPNSLICLKNKPQLIRLGLIF
jgi:hypothetical protein